MADDGPVAHYGEELHRNALAAKLNPRPEGLPDEYDLIKPHFDFAYYLALYPDIGLKNLDPVAHYILAGANEGRNPSPFFATRTYRELHRDEVEASGLTPLGHWVAAGAPPAPAPLYRNADALGRDVLGLDRTEMATIHRETYGDIRARLEQGTLGEMVRKATAIEPLIGAGWEAALGVRLLPLANDALVSRIWLTSAAQAAAEWRRARIVVVAGRALPDLAPDRTDRAVRDLAARFGAANVVVIATQDPFDVPQDRFPRGVRTVPFGRLSVTVNRDRERALAELLRSLRPELILGTDSDLMLDTLQIHGKVLADVARIAIHCPGIAVSHLGGLSGGWPRHVYRHFDLVSALCVDRPEERAALIDAFLIPEAQHAKLHVLPPHPDLPATPLPTSEAERPRIGWADRELPDARRALAYRVALEMPDCDFHVWTIPGGVAAGASHRLLKLPAKPENVTLEGEIDSLSDLPLDRIDAFLDTARGHDRAGLHMVLAGIGRPVIAASTDPLECGDEADAETLAHQVRSIFDGNAVAAPAGTPEAYGAAMANLLAALDMEPAT
ncbi:hypothetical protein E2L08_02940 [Palleronia sediminis]|uniref:Uncharacterized protein n=1 Tax=Palleronia sediminis TaxID=2547833 RepID=A0A4R6AM57_9RHOB|nr:hypothetical protein [Palleronia sediminis]TDL83618.1 hypothetical protein E2L08_02940 [Palleronia sediminis]